MTETTDYDDPADAAPCMDCGKQLLLSATVYAVDGAGVCVSCGKARYGGHAIDYLILGAELADDEALAVWDDLAATLGGVVAADSRCACGQEAWVCLTSPRWGAWDTCHRCGDEQLAVLHGETERYPADLSRVTAEALRSIQLDVILRA